jgi:hypothetical protein
MVIFAYLYIAEQLGLSGNASVLYLEGAWVRSEPRTPIVLSWIFHVSPHSFQANARIISLI